MIKKKVAAGIAALAVAGDGARYDGTGTTIQLPRQCS
jgi:hypothetical protein